jgi:hypothetical protein
MSEPKLGVFCMPEGLHPDTADLVHRFAFALAEKLAAAEKKYGYSNGWASADWLDECREHLRKHVDKGDPRDVAAYCAFLWHHGASTALARRDVQAEPVAIPADEANAQWRMKQAAQRAHALCNQLRLDRPEIAELSDTGSLHEAIHDILRVDTPQATPTPGDLRIGDEHRDAGILREVSDYMARQGFAMMSSDVLRIANIIESLPTAAPAVAPASGVGDPRVALSVEWLNGYIIDGHGESVAVSHWERVRAALSAPPRCAHGMPLTDTACPDCPRIGLADAQPAQAVTGRKRRSTQQLLDDRNAEIRDKAGEMADMRVTIREFQSALIDVQNSCSLEGAVFTANAALSSSNVLVPAERARSSQPPTVAQPAAVPAGCELRMLGYELSGVIADVESEHSDGFDSVCLNTVKRVRDALLAAAPPPPTSAESHGEG